MVIQWNLWWYGKKLEKCSSQSAIERPPYWQQDHSFLTFRMRNNYEITFSRHNLLTNQPLALSVEPRSTDTRI